VFTARRVISTFSAGVTNENIRRGTLFSPALPEWKRAALQKTSMATYMKIFMRFPRVFWDVEPNYLIWADPKVSAFEFNYACVNFSC
jgi:polyamine oxidase